MASLRKRGDRYEAVFRRTHNGRKQEVHFSLRTSSKTIASKHLRKLEVEQDQGIVNVFDNFNFRTWVESGQGTQSSEQVTLLGAIDRFLEARDDIREKTRAGYRDILTNMSNHISPTMPISMVTQTDIRDYLKTGNRKPVSQNTYLRHICVFFRWVEQQGLVSTDPSAGIQKKPVTETLADKIISEVELYLLLQTHEGYIATQEAAGLINRDSQRQLWFRPLIMTYFYAGLRLSEGLNLKWRNVDLNSRLMSVPNAKGGKTIVVAMQQKLVDELKRWKSFKTGELVFPSVRDGLTKEIPMVAGTVQKCFKRTVRAAGLSDSIHIHSLRHSCVTHLLSKGVDILTVNQTLRHSSLDVTRGYQHLTPHDTLAKFDKLGL
ncbi:MAG: tyrosine-type recombinase/integrase [Bacteroidetes bacterium]|nr:tyrosine-type recombinase/integrase [Bacteroidota bacterium]